MLDRAPLLFSTIEENDYTLFRNFLYKGRKRNSVLDRMYDSVAYILKDREPIRMTSLINSLRQTLLMAAAKRGRSEFIETVIEYLKDNFDIEERLEYINRQDGVGRNALHMAIENGDIRSCNILLQNAIDINTGDKTGKTALHYAVENGDIDIIKLLIDRVDCDINIQNKDGETALHIAVRQGREDIAKYLVYKGADINITNSEGKTAVDLSSSDTLKGWLKFIDQNRDDIEKKNRELSSMTADVNM